MAAVEFRACSRRPTTALPRPGHCSHTQPPPLSVALTHRHSLPESHARKYQLRATQRILNPSPCLPSPLLATFPRCSASPAGDPGPGAGAGAERDSAEAATPQARPVAEVKDGGPTPATSPSRSSTQSPPQRGPPPRALSAEDRAALGLAPRTGARNIPAPASLPRPAPPQESPSRAASSSSAPGKSGRRRAVGSGQWTLLDEMDKEGFGYWSPDENEWQVVTVARRWGNWLLSITKEGGGDNGAQSGSGLGPISILLFVVFPTWLVLLLVAAGRVDLPPAVVGLQDMLRTP